MTRSKCNFGMDRSLLLFDGIPTVILCGPTILLAVASRLQDADHNFTDSQQIDASV